MPEYRIDPSVNFHANDEEDAREVAEYILAAIFTDDAVNSVECGIPTLVREDA